MQIFNSGSSLSTSSSITARHVDAAQPRRVADGHRVEPAAAPRPPRDRAVLVAAVADVLADLVVLLGGKRPAADPRRVGLDDRRSPWSM